MSIYPVLSQKAYPGVGDIDDCWAIATIWAAVGAKRTARKPSIYEFRKAAGNPDDPWRSDGGNIDQIARAIPIIWPGQPYSIVKTLSWAEFRRHLDAGQYISVACLSSRLPYSLRFGFYGNHQVGVVKVNGVIYCANPLAPNGSAPQPIREEILKYAVVGVANGWKLAACFTPVGAASTSTSSTGARNVTIRYAGVQSVTSRFALAEGQRLYDKPGGVVVTRLSRTTTVPLIGLAGSVNGKPWRAVLIGTAAGYSDDKPHRTVLYVPDSAGKVIANA